MFYVQEGKANFLTPVLAVLAYAHKHSTDAAGNVMISRHLTPIFLISVVLLKWWVKWIK